jgi:hypothetical protein
MHTFEKLDYGMTLISYGVITTAKCNKTAGWVKKGETWLVSGNEITVIAKLLCVIFGNIGS